MSCLWETGFAKNLFPGGRNRYCTFPYQGRAQQLAGSRVFGSESQRGLGAFDYRLIVGQVWAVPLVIDSNSIDDLPLIRSNRCTWV